MFQRILQAAAPQQQQQQPSAAQHELAPASAVPAAGASTGASSAQQQQQQQQQGEQGVSSDCLGCRVTGLMLGLGGGGYVSSRLFEHPKPVGAHRYTLIGVSAGLFALGIGRAIGL
jgi:F0F1-type ATP synthase assembly protein I